MTIVRVQLHDDGTATQVGKWTWASASALEQALDGAIWVMEDEGGYLPELRPHG